MLLGPSALFQPLIIHAGHDDQVVITPTLNRASVLSSLDTSVVKEIAIIGDPRCSVHV